MPPLIAPCNVPGFVFLVKRIQSTECGRHFLIREKSDENYKQLLNDRYALKSTVQNINLT